MTSPDRKSTSELKVGEMPTPRYLLRAGDTTGEGSIRWIGIDAYALDGEIKEFLWWKNFKIGDLNNGKGRYDTAAFIARLKLERGADSAIGLPVDLSKSNVRTGHVEIDKEPGIYGVYVEADKRPMFNFMVAMQGIKSEAELRQSNPVEFDELFQKAKAVLPYPKASTKQESKKGKNSESQSYKSVNVEFGTGDITRTTSDALITLINSGRMWFGGVDTAIQESSGSDFHRIASIYMDSHSVSDGVAIFADGSTIESNRGFKSVIFVIDDLKLPLSEIVEAGLVEAYKRDLQTVTMPLMRSGVMAGVKEKTLDEVAEQMVLGIKNVADKNPNKPLTAKIVIYSDQNGENRQVLNATAKRLLK